MARRSDPSGSLAESAERTATLRSLRLGVRDNWASRTKSWIHGVPQSVSQEIERGDGKDDGEARESGNPPRREEGIAAVVDHVAPARRRRLHPEAEEGKGGFDQNRVADAQRRV